MAILPRRRKPSFALPMRTPIAIFIILCLLTANLVNAQSSQTIDSLKKVLETDLPERERVDVYNAIAHEYRGTDSTKTALFTSKAIELSNEISYPEGVSDAYYHIGWATMIKGDYTKATSLFLKGLAAAQSVSYPRGEAYAHNGLGIVHYYQGDYSSALEQWLQSLKISQQIDDKKWIANSYNNIGRIHEERGNYSLALEYHLESLKIREEMNGKSGMADSYSNIGKIYEDLGDYSTALEQYQESLKIRKELDEKGKMAISYSKIGKIYERKGDYIAALEEYYKSLEIRESLGEKYGIANSYNNLGEIYLKQKEYERAIEFKRRSLDLYNEIGSKALAVSPLLGMGKVYLAQKQYDQAISFLEEATRKAQELGESDIVRDGAEQLTFAYEGVEDYKAAFKSMQLFKTMADSLKSAATTKAITSRALLYEFEKREAETQALQERKDLVQRQQLQTQKYYTYASIGGGLALLIIALVIYRGQQKQKKANRLLAQQKDEIGLQAEALQVANEKLVKLDGFKQGMTGMIVHDLKNPLNLILNASGGTERQLELMRQSSQMMLGMVMNILDVQKFEDTKMVLNLRDSAAYTVAQNAVRATNFLSRQKNISVDNQIDRNLSVKADPEILERVFTNILTNAVKYTAIGGCVVLTSQLDGGRARLSITDNGSGIPKDQQDMVFQTFGQVQAKNSGVVRSTGLGLAFCKMAVHAHGGEIGLESEVGAGTTFWFDLEVGEAVTNPSESSVPEEDHKFRQLDATEKAVIGPYLESLKALEVFYNSDIKDVLDQMPLDTPGLKKWREEMERILYFMDSEAYKAFLDEVG